MEKIKQYEVTYGVLGVRFMSAPRLTTWAVNEAEAELKLLLRCQEAWPGKQILLGKLRMIASQG